MHRFRPYIFLFTAYTSSIWGTYFIYSAIFNPDPVVMIVISVMAFIYASPIALGIAFIFYFTSERVIERPFLFSLSIPALVCFLWIAIEWFHFSSNLFKGETQLRLFLTFYYTTLATVIFSLLMKLEQKLRRKAVNRLDVSASHSPPS
ncbi:MAG: hypothetical protein MI743_01695 [Sneathiellales bacterium]|nr:hypothetical protein [Sneathiellales bacterium]